MRGDQLELRIALEEAVEDHAAHRERGVEHEADRGDEAVLHHVELLGPRRRAGMDQHREPAAVDLAPDRTEGFVSQGQPPDIRQHHHAHRAELVARALQLGDRELGVLPGQRAHEADALRVALLLRSHIVVNYS